jgi:uncharacterized cupredoxin-like copper-binding protein
VRIPIALLSAAAILAIISVGLVTLERADAAVMGPMERAQQDVAVTLTEWSVEPRSIAVKAGQPVRFHLRNPGERSHELNIHGGRTPAAAGGLPAETWSSPRLTAGQTTEWTVTLPRPGTYQILCPVGDGGHKDQGMVGTLIAVGEADDAVIPIPVTLGSFWIRPAVQMAVAGQPTRFDLNNPSPNTHDLLIKGQGSEWQSPRVAAGTSLSWDVTIENPGVYELYCSLGDGAHRELGMVGALEVLPVGASMMGMWREGTP